MITRSSLLLFYRTLVIRSTSKLTFKSNCHVTSSAYRTLTHDSHLFWAQSKSSDNSTKSLNTIKRHFGITSGSSKKMAPISAGLQLNNPDDLRKWVDSKRVVIFSKTTCPFCEKTKKLFSDLQVQDVHFVELDTMGEEGAKIQKLLQEVTDQNTVPNVFVNGTHLGGNDDCQKAKVSGLLGGLLTYEPSERNHNFDYDVVIIGGGSGGLAASKEAARLGRKVAVCDFVTPSPPGTTWGLGGTCVNVGCIPKKLFHQASIVGEERKGATNYGWSELNEETSVDWSKLVENIQMHIGSLNWGYKVALRDKKVKYLNELASFVDKNTIKTVNKKGKESTVTAKYFILATGGRPKYPDIPGALEYGITSDDIFSIPSNPGKTLFVGASYISLECAGFCHGLGINSTVMVRSILLRGFDQQMANKIGNFMENTMGINFVHECVPTKLELVEDGSPKKIKVTAKYNDGTEYTDTFNTVVFAIGRDAETKKLNVEEIGVKLNPENGKVLHDEKEQTSVENIFAIGDILDGKPELTPMAIQSGLLLARRLCKISEVLTDYDKVPTTVFTPIEYGCCGLAEEEAVEKYGEENVEVYHKNFWPLEWTLPKKEENACYAKLVCLKNQEEKVIGLHYLGPNAGEVTQGFAGMLVMDAKKSDFDRLVGIHPTTAEVFTGMDITKDSGVDPAAAGC